MSTTKRLLFLTIALCTLLIPVAAQDALPTPSAPFQLQVGVPLEANLNDSNFIDRYTFEAPDGADISLRMTTTTGTLDSTLRLLNAEGVVAQSNALQQGEPNARIDIEDAPGGVYIVEASRFDGEDGITSGAYSLMLDIAGVTLDGGDEDALPLEPPFGVEASIIDQPPIGSGQLTPANPKDYFAVVGDPGDLLTTIFTVTGGDGLVASVQILNPNSVVISESIQPRENEILAYATLLERAWYLIEVTRLEGSGSFSLFVNRVAGEVMDYEENSEAPGEFGINAPGSSFIFNGDIGDEVTISVIARGGTSPQIRLLDVRQRELASDTAESIALLQAGLPRSGTYVVQVNNTSTGATGPFTIRLSANDAEPVDFNPIPVTYNNAYKGDIPPQTPFDMYAFEGNRGELVTVRMDAAKGDLDPFLVLMDGQLNEIISNDNALGSRNALIGRVALPADGTYYILAGRSDLAFGNTTGNYNLQLSAGEISLVDGAVTATLTWGGDEDLNLFLREPSGRIVSWSNPSPPNSAALQVDSNTNCETITDQPVEHLYWEQPPTDEDYELWVWYQQACGSAAPVPFELTLQHNLSEEIVVVTQQAGTLTIGQRFELGVRVSTPDVFVLGDGQITMPSPQQRVSEGGDIPLVYGTTSAGRLDDQVYARFYQFQGDDGDEIEIEVEALTGDLDPLLILRDDTERNVVPPADDISAENRDARLRTTLPQDGRYVIAVTRYGVEDGLTTGDYALTIRRTPSEVASGE